MIQPLTLLFVCQLAGEALVRLSGVAFPGPVLGMGLLVAGLLIAGRAGPALESLADGILKNLSLLFVPAAVGIVQQAGLIAAHWLAIAVAVVVSTVATLIVTVLTFRGVVRLQGGGRA
jgi:holin-like protein